MSHYRIGLSHYSASPGPPLLAAAAEMPHRGPRTMRIAPCSVTLCCRILTLQDATLALQRVASRCSWLLQQEMPHPCATRRLCKYFLPHPHRTGKFHCFRASGADSESSLHLSAHTMAACTSDFPHLTLKHVSLHSAPRDEPLDDGSNLSTLRPKTRHIDKTMANAI